MDGLPIALAALGHRCMVISPRYDQYAEAWDTGYWGSVNMGGKHLGLNKILKSCWSWGCSSGSQ